MIIQTEGMRGRQGPREKKNQIASGVSPSESERKPGPAISSSRKEQRAWAEGKEWKIFDPLHNSLLLRISEEKES